MQKTPIKELISKFKDTHFTLRFWDGEEIEVGTPPSQFKIILNEPIHTMEFIKSYTLAFGEAYMNKALDIEGDLYESLDAILKYKRHFHTHFHLLPHIFHTSTHAKTQKQQVSSHYDLGNDFYKLWLDETMSYSCAYFKKDTDTLYEAQMNKIHHILKKLYLEEGQTLLDIGCGWGNLLIEAAKCYKVKGLGITLSTEQHAAFKSRIQAEGLTDLLDVKLMDYRDLIDSGLKFDRIVSVGMLEHVGRKEYPTFFKAVDAVLKEEGLCFLHYISGLTESPGDAWIKKYIFPGGVIPSLREIITLSANHHFYTLDVESLRRHYTKTLLEWYKNFEAHLPEIETMFDEKFIRMWRMYLCSCAACFNNGIVDLHQILFSKGVNNTLPMTRESLYK